MMRLFLFALALLAGGVSPAWAGSITYDLQSYSSLQNGYTLSGSITTDGTFGNLVGSSHILDWNYTISQGMTIISSVSRSTSNSLIIVQNLTATSTQLTLGPSTATSTNVLLLENNAFTLDDELFYRRGAEGTATPIVEYTGFTNGQANWLDTQAPVRLGGDTWVIATAETAAAPEPASMTLLGIGALGMAGTAGAADNARRKRECP